MQSRRPYDRRRCRIPHFAPPREPAEIGRQGFHVYAGSVLPARGFAHLVSAGAPVCVGGLSIQCGDLFHGDRHGVLSIPAEVVPDLPRAARDLVASERLLIERATRAPLSLPALIWVWLRQAVHDRVRSLRR